MNYNDERSFISELPQIDALPDLNCFADNGLGISIFGEDKMIGY